MLLPSSKDVYTRNKSFPHCRLSSVAIYLTGHLAAALLEKKQQTLDISRGRPLAKGGGAYIRGKVHNII